MRVLCRCINIAGCHSLSLEDHRVGGVTVYFVCGLLQLLFKITEDDIRQSYSIWVDCVLCVWAVTAYNSKPQRMILEGHTVGGLTCTFVDQLIISYNRLA